MSASSKLRELGDAVLGDKWFVADGVVPAQLSRGHERIFSIAGHDYAISEEIELIVTLRNVLPALADVLDAAEAMHVALEGNHANVYECADAYRAARAKLGEMLR